MALQEMGVTNLRSIDMTQGPVGIVVLGASIRYEMLSGKAQLVGALARRAREAAHLYAIECERGGAVIVATGGRVWNGVSEATALRDALVSHGVPREKVVRELCSLSTVENARFSMSLIATLGVRRAVVVSCEWHIPRALSSFRREGARLGIEVTGHAAPAPPTRTALRLARWLHERAGIAADAFRSSMARSGEEVLSV